MDEPVRILGLEDLEAHLEQLVDDPQTPLNAKLFDDVELQLTGMLNLQVIISSTFCRFLFVKLRILLLFEDRAYPFS